MLTLSFLAIRFSGLTAAADVGGFCDPNGYVNSSASATTSFGVPEPVTALALIGTAQSFTFKVAEQTGLFGGRILARIPWVLTTQATGAATRAKLKITLTVGTTTPVVVYGAERNLNNANGTRFTEIVALDIGSQILTPGTSITITVQPEVTTVSATPGDVVVTTLEHDPNTLVSQFAIDMTAVGAV